jgi:hypothetical protein
MKESVTVPRVQQREEKTMPLLDHFHPPLSLERRWESFHSSWATRIADALTERWLPPGYIAEEHAHIGPSVEIDVGTFEALSSPEEGTGRGPVATLSAKGWAPPAPDAVFPSVVPDTFEVRILSTATGPKLVAAIELISHGNKDRATERRAFATKCASYLYQGISLVIVDIVTSRRANLHNEILRVMEAADTLDLAPHVSLYAVAYRPLRRDGTNQIGLWRSPLALNQPLPVLPLSLDADLVIPVDFEATYVEACRRKQLTAS